ncbi:MAG: YggT family protein [Allosphingosinicella sp.]|jgi:YggT family protein|uniref:YggT family protein n=1 Tax=Sphingomonadales TaxID=204457 RepID=UPI0014098CAB|nr:YggT family protein [Sphingosinicella sp. YJ22]
MLAGLLLAIDFLLNVLIILIIGQAILSWLVAFNVINTRSDGMRRFLMALDRMTDPIYRPIRRILPDFGGIDFSPLVVLLLIKAIQIVIRSSLTGMPL